MLDQKDIDYINSLSYEQMLEMVRFGKVGHRLFVGETGEFFFKIMYEKRELVDHVAISKRIGWDN